MNKLGFTKLFLRKLRRMNNLNLSSDIKKTIDEIDKRARIGYESLMSFLMSNKSKPMASVYRGYKVYKYYANESSGARIIYSYGSDMNNDYLLCFLNIETEHKKQGKTAKTKIDDSIIDYNYEMSYLVEEEKFTNVLYDYSLKGCEVLLDSDQQKSSYINPPCLITGTAGTGKTLVSLKIILDNEKKGHQNYTYISLSPKLLNSVYTDFCMELGDEPKYVRFITIKDFFESISGCKMAEYEHFLVFYNNLINEITNLSKQKYTKEIRDFGDYLDSSAISVYHVIRKDIKGSMLMTWNRDIKKSLIDEKDFYDIYSREQENVDYKYLKYLYYIALKYQEYLDENNMYDENDLARMIVFSRQEYIIVDEAQDLTEVEIYSLYKISSTKIYLFGDSNQILNPSSFKPSNLLKLNPNINIPSTFITNYRNSYEISLFLQELNDLRKKYINTQKVLDEQIGVSSKSDIHKNPIYMLPNHITKEEIEEFLKKPNTALVVASNDVKKDLGLKEVYTVFEIKGSTVKNILCYNLTSYYQKEWEKIKNFEAKSKKYSAYRYYFNLLYVASSRATDCILFYEDTFSFLDEFKLDYVKLSHDEYIDFVDNIDDDFNDYYDEILEIEDNKQFDLALQKLSDLPSLFNYDITKDYNRIKAKKDFYENTSKDISVLKEIARNLYLCGLYDLMSLISLSDEDLKDITKELKTETKEVKTQKYEPLYLKGKIKKFNLKKLNYDDIFLNPPFNNPKLEYINNHLFCDEVYGVKYKLHCPINTKKYSMKQISEIIECNCQKMSLKKIKKLLMRKGVNDAIIDEVDFLPKMTFNNEFMDKKMASIYDLECKIIYYDAAYEIIYSSDEKKKIEEEMANYYQKLTKLICSIKFERKE